MAKITKVEYYRLKAENAELKLANVERKHKQEMDEMKAVLNEFLSLMGESEMCITLHSFNLRVVLNRVLQKNCRGSIPFAILKGHTHD